MKTKRVVLICAVTSRVFLTLGGATCIAEGHPLLGAFFIALGMGAMELKEQLSKKQNPPG
jgi:hypothetical protein